MKPSNPKQSAYPKQPQGGHGGQAPGRGQQGGQGGQQPQGNPKGSWGEKNPQQKFPYGSGDKK